MPLKGMKFSQYVRLFFLNPAVENPQYKPGERIYIGPWSYTARPCSIAEWNPLGSSPVEIISRYNDPIRCRVYFSGLRLFGLPCSIRCRVYFPGLRLFGLPCLRASIRTPVRRSISSMNRLSPVNWLRRTAVRINSRSAIGSLCKTNFL